MRVYFTLVRCGWLPWLQSRLASSTVELGSLLDQIACTAWRLRKRLSFVANFQQD